MKKVKLGKMVKEGKPINMKGMRKGKFHWQEVDFGDFCGSLLQPRIQKVFQFYRY